MVRCIPTFVILGLISSLTYNHPISIDNVEEIVETAGIQAFEESIDIFDTEGIQVFEENKINVQAIENDIFDVTDSVAKVITDSISITEDIETVGIQAIDENEEDITAGVQAIEDDSEDIVAGVQGVEDIDEDVIAEIQAFDDEATSVPIDENNNVVAQTIEDQANDESIIMDFELFEEPEEETTVPTMINDDLTPVQVAEEISSNPLISDPETVSAIEDLALDTLNKLKALNIIRSNVIKLNLRGHHKSSSKNKHKDHSDSESDSDSDDDEKLVDSPDDNLNNDSEAEEVLVDKPDDNLNNDSDAEEELVDKPDEPSKTDLIFEINETEVPKVPVTEAAPEVETDIPDDFTETYSTLIDEIHTTFVTESDDEPTEEIFTQLFNDDEFPTEVFNEDTPVLVKRTDDDYVDIALFEVEDETEKNDFETVTELVTEVHVVSAIIDDEDQPTIGAINIPDNQDIEEDIPLFGVIEEIDDDEEVLIAKRDAEEVFAEIDYELVQVNEYQSANDEEVTETLVISGVLIDLTGQDQQSDAVFTEAATYDVDVEEPTYIN